MIEMLRKFLTDGVIWAMGAPFLWYLRYGHWIVAFIVLYLTASALDAHRYRAAGIRLGIGLLIYGLLGVGWLWLLVPADLLRHPPF